MPRFEPGFRASASDLCAIAAAIVGATALYPSFPAASLIIAVTTFHFFLFCNVFRIRRRPELIWAGGFLLLSYATIRFGSPDWPATIAAAFSLATGLIMRETRHPSYHGIGWKRLNPRLETWWNATQRSMT